MPFCIKQVTSTYSELYGGSSDLSGMRRAGSAIPGQSSSGLFSSNVLLRIRTVSVVSNFVGSLLNHRDRYIDPRVN